MTHRLLLLAALAGCEARLEPPSDAAPNRRLDGETLYATGMGLSGGYTGHLYADLSCGTPGGVYSRDCGVFFTAEPADGGGLWITVEDFHPSENWKRDDLVEILTGHRLLVGHGAPAAGSLGASWNGWDYELTLDGDELSLDLDGTYDDLDRCSGERIVMTCEASLSDPELGELALPPPVPLADGADVLVISEILADPTACSDSSAEWIEIQNLSPRRVQLDGLAVEDAAGGASVVEDGAVVEAFGRAVVGRGALSGFCDPAVAPDAGMAGAVSLNNGGDTVRLLVAGALADEVVYGPLGAGVAWGRDAVGAWCEGAPSPGAPTADCPRVEPVPARALLPGDLQVTEVMFDPSAMSDTSGEWIEVLNASAAPVDLAGLIVEDEAGGRGVVEASAVVAPGGLVVLGRGGSAGWDGAPLQPDAWYGSAPALNNAGDLVALRSDAGIVDATPVLAPRAGVAAQRDGEAWCDAAAPLGASERGTPGEPNGACP